VCVYTRSFGDRGKDYAQPLWNLTTLAATFLEDGHARAHKMGKHHPGYSRESTDALWERKNHERKEKGLGWPSCTAIQSNGCTGCATCPHLSKGKSPLHLALPAATPDLDNILGQVEEGKINPVAAMMTLREQGADIKTLLLAMNSTFAVAKYGSKIVVASIIGNDISFMTDEDFHKMFANLVVYEEVKAGKQGATKTDAIKVSKRWFDWKDRRQYFGRGVIFEPGGPLEIPNDMLNLWRGFGIEPKQGDWSLMRAHILNVMCSGNQEHFDYLIQLMACGVQHLDKPLGVAVALLGEQGTGKGVVARTFGKFFGKHFVHIAHSEHLTGRFNALIGNACAVFLNEALWAGDKKGEGVLKALITEPSFPFEAKFRDTIMVENRLRIWVASNSDWAVPAGIGDRRWFVLNAANTYAGTGHGDYWDPLYAELENGGEAAMLYDLLAMDLRSFDVRVIPHTAAKAQQQVRSLHGTMSWLHHVLQEGAIGGGAWQNDGLAVSKDHAYMCYEEFSKRQHAWRPEIKAVWSKHIRAVLGPNVEDTRPTTGNERVRSIAFAPLAVCRRQFTNHIGAPDLEWEEPDNEPGSAPGAAVGQTAEDTGSDALHDAPSIEWEPELEPEPDNWSEYEPEDELEGDE
jgi:hypothetical protein